MINRNNKKGFTIVELVIVIAVIAILAAVLIPTFAGIIKKANLSADQQAVRQMNTVLAANEVLEGESIFELYSALAESGMDGEDYKPLTKDTLFFWDAKLNRILHVDSNMKVIVPAEYEGKTFDPANDTWISLSMELFETNIKAPAQADGYTDHKVSGPEGADVKVKVTTAGELAFVFNYLNKELSTNQDALPTDYTIDLGGNVIDMMGASLTINEIYADARGEAKTFTIKNGIIKNVSLVEPTALGDGKTPGKDGQYAAGLVAKVKGKASLTIDGVTFEGIHVNNSHLSQAALLVAYAQTNGTIKINNVTIKNSSLLAHRSAGALIGNVKGAHTRVDLNKITMSDVDVKTVGGRSAMLIGYFQPEIKVEDSTSNFVSSDIKLTNCNFSLYECAQNTGTSPEGDKLGLQSNGTVYSYCYNAGGAYDYNNDDKKYIANALMLMQDQSSGNSYFDDSVTGWNE